MEYVISIVNIVLPIFLIILLGLFLKRINFIDNNFVEQISKFVFNISLPVLVFIKLANVKITAAFDAGLISASLILTFVFFLFSWMLASLITKTPEDKGAFIQGSFRSNYAIVGLAIISGLVDDIHFAKAVLLLAFMVPLFNVLAVIALTVPLHQASNNRLIKSLKEILRNPIIISAYLAIPFTIFDIELPPAINITLQHLGKVALPLALLGIGASINVKKIFVASPLSFVAAANKIILFPLVTVIVAVFLEFTQQDILILYVAMGSPTAIASFVMAVGMKSNSKMASNIITISTLGAIITISAGLMILKFIGINFIMK
jgi:predicted permease